jgi:AcrR family transcriptional regulator
MKRARGRPRQYDEESALQAAGQVFWTKGFSATSLDDLSVAMGMNRPSIYGAFGDKEALYRRALMQFCEGMEAAFERTMLAEDVYLRRTAQGLHGDEYRGSSCYLPSRDTGGSIERHS